MLETGATEIMAASTQDAKARCESEMSVHVGEMWARENVGERKEKLCLTSH
jgi:hypothetical protein